MRDFAKFISGVIVGDFLCSLWLYAGGHLPISILGITFDQSRTIAWLIFEIVLFAIVAYYGWNTKRSSSR